MELYLDRLIEIGRRRGGLTVDDLQRHLPVEALSPAKLADVLAVLENAGVNVEIDPALTRGRPPTAVARSATSRPPAEDVVEDRRGRIDALGTSIRSSRERVARAPRFAHQYRGGTVFLGAAVFGCYLVARRTLADGQGALTSGGWLWTTGGGRGFPPGEAGRNP